MFFICYSLYLHVSLCPCLSVIFLALRLSLTPSQSSWVSICPSYSLFLCLSFLFFPLLFQSLYSYNSLPITHLYIHHYICLDFFIHSSIHSILSISSYVFLNLLCTFYFSKFLSLTLSLSLPLSLSPFSHLFLSIQSHCLSRYFWCDLFLHPV